MEFMGRTVIERHKSGKIYLSKLNYQRYLEDRSILGERSGRMSKMGKGTPKMGLMRKTRSKTEFKTKWER